MWLNRVERSALPQYMATFADNTPRGGGAQQPKNIRGLEALESYLAELDLPLEDVKQWVKELHETGSVSIQRVQLTEEQLAPYMPQSPLQVTI